MQEYHIIHKVILIVKFMIDKKIIDNKGKRIVSVAPMLDSMNI